MGSDEEKQLPSTPKESVSDITLSVDGVDLIDEQEKISFLSTWIEEPNEHGGSLIWRKGKQTRTKSLVTWVLMGSGMVLISFVSFYIGFLVEGPNHQDYLVAKLVPSEVLPYVKGKGFAPYLENTRKHRFLIDETAPDTPFWRQLPSDEVDQAWYDAARNHLMLLTEDDIIRQGKIPDEHVKLPEEWGYGEHKYLARFWHPHRIHCLDSLRKILYRDYYYNETNIFSTFDLRHGAHCLATIYEYLQCHPAWDLIHYVWVKGAPAPYTDWRRVDVCQSMDPMHALDDKHKEMLQNRDRRVAYMMAPAGDDQFMFDFPDFMAEYIRLTKLEHPEWNDGDEQWVVRETSLNKSLEEWHRTGTVPTFDAKTGWF